MYPVAHVQRFCTQDKVVWLQPIVTVNHFTQCTLLLTHKKLSHTTHNRIHWNTHCMVELLSAATVVAGG